ncbi:MAG: monofunctional biosynthetic peptidoglycan transglycosylase [Tannerellaceae bacterium]|jgi:monofunctional biosynthetic peptidoglycan transglycosylase|nr:monofunctional biosynthetic peptidoglycan transglycosylase [Tannerellaceae bacterium]
MKINKIMVAKAAGTAWKWCRRVVFWSAVGSVALVVVLRFVPVYWTPLMLIRVCEQWGEGRPAMLKHRWVSIERIAEPLALAVVAAEDNRFLIHRGFDLEQIVEARRDADRGRRLRGASTISQQTAKNVFLWPGKSYVRKGLEAYFTALIEVLWGKRRIMEVYLNSIEMGDGIYGAEATAAAHFGKGAAALSRGEAALIAASLPNPRRLRSDRPSAYLLKRQGKILSLMGKIGPINWGVR